MQVTVSLKGFAIVTVLLLYSLRLPLLHLRLAGLLLLPDPGHRRRLHPRGHAGDRGDDGWHHHDGAAAGRPGVGCLLV